jgi:hypothetical protein
MPSGPCSCVVAIPPILLQDLYPPARHARPSRTPTEQFLSCARTSLLPLRDEYKLSRMLVPLESWPFPGGCQFFLGEVQQGGDPRKVDRRLFFQRYFPDVHYVRNTLKLKLDWFTAVYEAKGEEALATWHGKQDEDSTFAVFQTKFAKYKV